MTDNNDIYSPDLYLDGIPYDRFARLRREAPVSFQSEPDGGPGFWAITKHRDVFRVLKDAATFSSAKGGTLVADLPEQDLRRSPDNLIVMDPPKHSRYRALISQAFTPRVLKNMEGYIGQLVGHQLNQLIERGRFDFMGDFAGRLPISIILTMVGVPQEDQDQLNQWIWRILATDDPEFAVSREELMDTGRRFMEYAHSLAAERRKAPKEDLLSLLMAAEVDGQKLSYEEFGTFFILLLAAGSDTPRLALGSAVLTLIQRPDLRRRIQEEPALVPKAVEEVLRYHPPLTHFRRTATCDTQIAGQDIREGDKVVVWTVSANRDEEVFANPDTFDIERGSNDHISFGYGPHFCLGSPLARSTLRIALGECLRRMPELRQDGPTERLRSNWLNGMKRLPVAVR